MMQAFAGAIVQISCRMSLELEGRPAWREVFDSRRQ